jgi:hypothetical protein
MRLQDRLDGTSSQRRRLAPTLAAVAEAYEIRTSAEHWRRFEIEARVLAGQSFRQIEARSGIPAATAEAYERLFFAVTEKLSAPDYIFFRIDPTLSLLFGRPTEEVIVKRLAYRGGPIIVDTFFEFLHRRRQGLARTELLDGRRVLSDDVMQWVLDVLAMPFIDRSPGPVFRLTSFMADLARERVSRSARAVSGPVTVDPASVSLIVESVLAAPGARDDRKSSGFERAATASDDGIASPVRASRCAG